LVVGLGSSVLRLGTCTFSVGRNPRFPAFGELFQNNISGFRGLFEVFLGGGAAALRFSRGIRGFFDGVFTEWGLGVCVIGGCRHRGFGSSPSQEEPLARWAGRMAKHETIYFGPSFQGVALRWVNGWAFGPDITNLTCIARLTIRYISTLSLQRQISTSRGFLQEIFWEENDFVS
jgi:hypothetical protein